MKKRSNRLLLIPIFLVVIWVMRNAAYTWNPELVDPINPEKLTSQSITQIQVFISSLTMLVFLFLIFSTGLAVEDTTKTNAQNKKFTRSLLISLLVSFGVIAAINFIINPWGLYPMHLFPSRLENSRAQKIEIFDQLAYDPQIVVLGSSRSVGISAEYIGESTGEKAFNAAVFGGRPNDYIYITDYILDHTDSPPNLFLVEINGLLELKPETDYIDTPINLVPYLSLENKINWYSKRFENLFSIVHLSESIYAVRYQSLYSDDDRRWEEWEFSEAGSGTRPPNPLFEEFLQDRIENRDNVDCYFSSQIPYYESLIQTVREKNGVIVFYTTPFHPQYYRKVLIPNEEYSNCLTEQAQYFLEANQAYGGIYYFNFDDLDSINGIDTDQGFYDNQHITPQNSNLLIDALVETIREAVSQ